MSKKVLGIFFLCVVLISLTFAQEARAQSRAKRTINQSLPRDLLLQLIRDDTDVRNFVDSDPSQRFSADLIDLNGDGKPEYIVLPPILMMGNSSGPAWVYQRTGSGYRQLFAGGWMKYRLLGTSTNGFRDLEGFISGSMGTNRSILRFDGSRYRENHSSSSSTDASTQSWEQFISVFRAAARTSDRQVLRTMMTRDFEWAGDGKVGPDEALKNLDQGLVSWKKFIKSVNGRVVTCKLNDSSCWNFSGRPAKRTTGPEWLVFELGGDGRWRWARLVGD